MLYGAATGLQNTDASGGDALGRSVSGGRDSVGNNSTELPVEGLDSGGFHDLRSLASVWAASTAPRKVNSYFKSNLPCLKKSNLDYNYYGHELNRILYPAPLTFHNTDTQPNYNRITYPFIT